MFSKQKFTALMDLARAQGMTTTASVAIAGALSSTMGTNLTLFHIVYFTIISAFLHGVLNIYIAMGDVKLDSHTYVPERNPLITGKLSVRDAKHAVYIGTILGFCSAGLFFVHPGYQFNLALPTVSCMVLAYFWLIWYGYRGKYYIGSYDFSFSVSYAFWVLFGTFAVGGLPTVYTWLFIGVVATAGTAFAQWENGLKDVDADRAVGVKSIAVLTGVRSGYALGYCHPYFIYGLVLKVLFLLFCFLAYFESRNIYLLVFLIAYSLPTQMFILYRFATVKKPIEHRRTILYDVPLSAFTAFAVLVPKVGFVVISLLILYLIAGYFIGSAVQSECEFKFRRFAGKRCKNS